MSKRNEQLLVQGAALHWPGSEEHCLAIYRALTGADTGLKCAVWLNIMLGQPPLRDQALSALTQMLRGPPARKGPKMDRWRAADAAIVALREMLAAGGVA